MKIAILTQPLRHNYGGILQNYALKIILERQGANKVTTINRIKYKPSIPRKVLSKIKNQTLNRINGSYHYQLNQRKINYIYSENISFLDSYINLTEEIGSSKELKKYFAKQDFDTVVVGSDQTWRPRYSPCITDYFLDFLVDNESINKIAYACSFGTSNWEFNKKQQQQCKKLIPYFNAISVREKTGINLCRKYLNTEAQLVLDPTLLLKKQDYIKLIENKFGNNTPAVQGVFNYILDDNKEKFQLVESIANYLNVSSFRTQPNKKLPVSDKKNLEDYKYPSIEAWLNSFYSADYIITDSFHGTVLSIIFEKPFITLVNKDRGAARFESLLSLLGLEHRMLYDLNKFEISMLEDDIDYYTVNLKLDLLRKLSTDFLASALAFNR